MHSKRTRFKNYNFFKILFKFQKSIFIVTTLIIILSMVGISRLEVENSFINYFNKKY